MRWKVLAVGALLLVSGCLSVGSEGSDTSQAEASSESGESLNVSTNGSSTNETQNATYLKDSDYNETHVHDYWPGISNEKVLMNHDVNVNPFSSAFRTTFASAFDEPRTSVGWAYFSLPNGSFVPVGTGNLTVEVDATGALENGQIRLHYTPANTADWTEMEARDAEGEWAIDVSPEMTDPPHSKSTRWAFQLEATGNGGFMEGDVNVTITAEKTRELKQWPSHPDFWNSGEKTQLHLANVNETFDKQEVAFVDQATGDDDKNITLPEGTIVPPETETLLLDFWYEREAGATDDANSEVDLRVKFGSSSSYYSWVEDHIVEEKPGYKAYAIPVDGSNWDSPYASESNWKFRVNVPLTVSTEDTSLRFGLAEVGQGNVTIDATAFRETPQWIEQASEDR